MTQAKWDEMSKEEKAEYLRQSGSKIKSQQFLDGSKKVGDSSAVTRKYKMTMGGVAMSGWCVTLRKKPKKRDSKTSKALFKKITDGATAAGPVY